MAQNQERGQKQDGSEEPAADAGHARASDAAGGPAADGAPHGSGDWRDNAPADSVERMLDEGAVQGRPRSDGSGVPAGRDGGSPGADGERPGGA